MVAIKENNVLSVILFHSKTERNKEKVVKKKKSPKPFGLTLTGFAS